MKYIDTTVESVDRLKEARENINKGIIVLLIVFASIGILGAVFFAFEYTATGIMFLISSSMYLCLLVGLIIKREIYSLAIIMKHVGGE